jgi:hypothetical protein
MPKLTALIASAALVLPAAAVVAPAEAATEGTRDFVKNCSKDHRGTVLRIKLRADRSKDLLRVRVSHPDGTGNFREPRVRRVIHVVVSTENGHGGLSEKVYRTDRPVYRFDLPHRDFAVFVTWRLTNGVRSQVFCNSVV